MRNRILIIHLLLILPVHFVASQDITGKIVCDTSNFRVIQVWGTHYERGYALGYLDAERILNLYNNYIVPTLGQAGIDTLKKYIAEEKHFRIPEKYKNEANGIVDGINSKAVHKEDFDYLDVLAANTYFDFLGFFSKADSPDEHGCSSLMSWGDATLSASLNGSSVISRHLDWSRNMYLYNSSTIVAHIPDEEDEQAWVMIGFSGQISALSGINSSGLGVFHHSLADFTGLAEKNKAYEPIWFTARNALEEYDFNDDMLTNTNDVRDAVLQNESGYANGSILSVISETDSEFDSLSAMVVESASEFPYHTFRYNDYEDLIPSDNLYAANASIKRNDLLHYEPRYYAIVDHIGDGLLIDPDKQNILMRDYSNSGSSSIQYMQFIPEEHMLKFSTADPTHYAYQKEFVCIFIDSLFEVTTSSGRGIFPETDFEIYPNPLESNSPFYLMDKSKIIRKLEVHDLTGRNLFSMEFNTAQTIQLVPVSLRKGLYFIRLSGLNNTYTKTLIVF
jgi:hypothetical protein